MALDSKGRSDLSGLQRTLSGEAQLTLVHMLFDLPHLEGSDLSRVALIERTIRQSLDDLINKLAD